MPGVRRRLGSKMGRNGMRIMLMITSRSLRGVHFLKVQRKGHRNFSHAPRGRLLCFFSISTSKVGGGSSGVCRIRVPMLGWLGPSRRRLCSADFAPGSKYECRSVRSGPLCGFNALLELGRIDLRRMLSSTHIQCVASYSGCHRRPME
jgi:hypothetical protein